MVESEVTGVSLLLADETGTRKETDLLFLSINCCGNCSTTFKGTKAYKEYVAVPI